MSAAAPHHVRRPLLFVALAASLSLLWALGPGSGNAQAAAPVCTDVHYTIPSGQQLPLPVIGPCSDADGDTMQGAIVDFPDHGSIGPGANGGGTYTSSPGYVGPDSFTYKVTANGEDSNVATTTIDVTPGPPSPGVQPPQCFPGFFQEFNGQSGVPVGPQCFDPDTPTGQLTATIVDEPQNGELTGDFGFVNNTARYTSDPGFSGQDTFTYRASDSVNQSALITVTIEVIQVPPGNEPPTCPESHAYVPQGGEVILRANCVDPDLDSITYNLAPPSVTKGVIDQFTPNSVRYRPNPGTAVGEIDVLGYSARDIFHNPVVFAVTIEITALGDDTFESAPEATPAEPYATSITAPVPGPVYIDNRAVTNEPDDGFFYLDQEVDITAPDAVDVADPLRFVFKIDDSKLDELAAQTPSIGPDDIIVFRNGDPVAECDVPGAGRAEPTPCIDGREVQPDGDLWITALTMQASFWNLGAAEVQDGDDDGVADEDDNCPTTANPSQLDADEDGIGAACDTKEVPTSKDDCKSNGWKSFNGKYTFKNQGDCVSFVATGGKNGPATK